jgi:CTP:molybdopterin cytidylyltransferase MocA
VSGTAAGLLLAAGAGRRMGRPKALLRDMQGVPFLSRAVGELLEGGCADVTVVLGAGVDQARALLDAVAAEVVVADDWQEGMGASLRAGLAALRPGSSAALVSLVDLPDVTAAVVARLLAEPVTSRSLARAAYDGVPGHPVLLGRDHWQGVAQGASGDKGARDYLAPRQVRLVECGDLASGRDVDTPSDLG